MIAGAVGVGVAESVLYSRRVKPSSTIAAAGGPERGRGARATSTSSPGLLEHVVVPARASTSASTASVATAEMTAKREICSSRAAAASPLLAWFDHRFVVCPAERMAPLLGDAPASGRSLGRPE